MVWVVWSTLQQLAGPQPGLWHQTERLHGLRVGITSECPPPAVQVSRGRRAALRGPLPSGAKGGALGLLASEPPSRPHPAVRC